MSGPPDLSDHEVAALLGAYALDACEPEERASIEAALARRPDLAREAEDLVQVAAWIGAAEAIAAPARLRDDVLARAAPREPVVDLYVAESDHFAAAVAALPASALDTRTANGLSARDLIVHVAAQESLLAQLVGMPTMDHVVETDIEARTARAIEVFGDRPLEDAIDAWRDAVGANRRWVVEQRDDVTEWRGITLSCHDAIVVRAFETWVHGNDLRRVAGLADRAPAERHLELMTDLAGRSLALSLALGGRLRPGRTAKLALTGAGGGEWRADMGGGAPGVDVDVTITADAVAWCRLVADRIAPDDLPCRIDGDRALAADLLAAAPALATL